MENRNSVKETIEDFLIKENCSERELARRIGISNSQIVRYKNGVFPEFKPAVKIANYFHCTLDYLFGLDDSFKSIKKTLILDEYNFINKYEKLLKDNHISHYKLCQKISICETSLRIWKKHRLPSTIAVIEIAKYFGVSIDYLVGKE